MGTSNKDPYKTLGVSKDASDEVIKKRHLTIVRELHTDTNQDGDETRLKEVNGAYEEIATAEKRVAYAKKRADHVASKETVKRTKEAAERKEQARKRREAQARSATQTEEYVRRAMGGAGSNAPGTPPPQPKRATTSPPPRPRPTPRQPPPTKQQPPPPQPRRPAPKYSPPHQPATAHAATQEPPPLFGGTLPSRPSPSWKLLIGLGTAALVILLIASLGQKDGVPQQPGLATATQSASGAPPAVSSSTPTSPPKTSEVAPPTPSTTQVAPPKTTSSSESPTHTCSTPVACVEEGAAVASGERPATTTTNVKPPPASTTTATKAKPRPPASTTTTTTAKPPPPPPISKTPPPTSTPPSSTTAEAPPSGDSPITGVTAEQVDPHTYRVSWTNPHDPSIAGWIITENPSDGSPSGFPVPKADISSEEVDDHAFETQFKFRAGVEYTICVAPFGHGLVNGQYPEMHDREGCAPAFKWE